MSDRKPDSQQEIELYPRALFAVSGAALIPLGFIVELINMGGTAGLVIMGLGVGGILGQCASLIRTPAVRDFARYCLVALVFAGFAYLLSAVMPQGLAEIAAQLHSLPSQ